MKKITLKSLDVDVINFILHNNRATIDELCNCFEVSQVNIRTVLAKIEEFVNKEKIGALLKENGEYYFENNNLNLNIINSNFLVEDLEKKERIVFIVLKLILEGSINLTSISKKINISRITLNSDMEFIKELISDFDLKLTSIQWRGVFFKGDFYNLQNFSILFISKLYIENYFSSPLKKLINPLVSDYFRKFLNYETEKKLLNLTNKIYQHFDIKLGFYHYFILCGILIYTHLGSKKNIEFFTKNTVKSFNLTETLIDILDAEDKALINNNISLILEYLSLCLNKKYSINLPINTDAVVKKIYSTFNLDDNNLNNQLLSFLINNIYLENRFFIPNYINFAKKDEYILEEEISIKIMAILNKYQIPFTKKDIAFLYFYLINILTETQKKNILIIDQSTMTWKGNRLKGMLQNSEQVRVVQVISYFNFKTFPTEIYNKYDIFIFIDLPDEKKENYSKQCCFINSYELIKNSLNISKLF